ncbi:MAG: hypothetical protein B6U72_03065 [Candidatus Altiarchaeales archaeon ex4484_2]|nr:MAG: hypothetical protein B6U72_03065 [Candidatus Altiarchaeales archaeon ex4484_2]
MNKEGRIIISALITISLVGILLTQIDLNEALSLLFSISPLWLLIGFAFYSLGYLLRSIRFSFLLTGKARVRDLFPIVCVHYLTNNILPARTGELTYIYLVKKLQKIQVSEGISSLTIARFFDFISITFLFILSAFLAEDVPLVVEDTLYYVSIAACLLIAVFVFLVYKSDAFISLPNWVIQKTGLHQFNAIVFIQGKLVETLTNLRVLRSKRLIFHCLWTSALTWLCIYLMTYSILKGLGFNLSIFLVILGSTISVFTNILPIPSIGAFGVYEGAWAVAFISLGVDKEAAIASGFVAHLALLIFSVILGGIGSIKLGYLRR